MPVIDISADVSISNGDATAPVLGGISFGTGTSRILDLTQRLRLTDNTINANTAAGQVVLLIDTAGVDVTLSPFSTLAVASLGFDSATTVVPGGTAVNAKASYNFSDSTIIWNGTQPQTGRPVQQGNSLVQGHLASPRCTWIMSNTHNLPDNSGSTGNQDLVFGGYAGRKINDGLSADFTDNQFIIPRDDTPNNDVFWQQSAIDPTNFIVNGVEFQGPWIGVVSPGLNWTGATMNGGVFREGDLIAGSTAGGSNQRGKQMNYRSANFTNANVDLLPQAMTTFNNCLIGGWWNGGLQTNSTNTSNFQHILFNCDIRRRNSYGDFITLEGVGTDADPYVETIVAEAASEDVSNIKVNCRSNAINHRAAHILAWQPNFVTPLGATITDRIDVHLDGSAANAAVLVQERDTETLDGIDNTDPNWVRNIDEGGQFSIVADLYHEHDAGQGYYFRQQFVTCDDDDDDAVALPLALTNRAIPYFSYENECYDFSDAARPVRTVQTDPTTMSGFNQFDPTAVLNTVVNPDSDVEGIDIGTAERYTLSAPTSGTRLAVDDGSKLLAGFKYKSAITDHAPNASYMLNGTALEVSKANITVNSATNSWDLFAGGGVASIFTGGSQVLNATTKVDRIRQIGGTGQFVWNLTGDSDIALEGMNISFGTDKTITQEVVASGTITWANGDAPQSATGDLINTSASISGTITLEDGTYTIRNADISGLTVNALAGNSNVILELVDTVGALAARGTGVSLQFSLDLTGQLPAHALGDDNSLTPRTTVFDFTGDTLVSNVPLGGLEITGSNNILTQGDLPGLGSTVTKVLVISTGPTTVPEIREYEFSDASPAQTVVYANAADQSYSAAARIASFLVNTVGFNNATRTDFSANPGLGLRVAITGFVSTTSSAQTNLAFSRDVMNGSGIAYHRVLATGHVAGATYNTNPKRIDFLASGSIQPQDATIFVTPNPSTPQAQTLFMLTPDSDTDFEVIAGSVTRNLVVAAGEDPEEATFAIMQGQEDSIDYERIEIGSESAANRSNDPIKNALGFVIGEGTQSQFTGITPRATQFDKDLTYTNIIE